MVDTNTVFSSLYVKGKPFEVFMLNKMVGLFEFVAPEFLFFEIGKRMDKLLAKSRLSKGEISDIFSFLKREIDFISSDKFEDKMEEAAKKAPHMKDAAFVALSLKLDCKILSGDKGIKKSLPDRVITPSEAIEMLLSKSG
ncbi:MAG: PIN domain-containing protein [Candidatus Aenigmatarchaeota archaeon]